VTALAVVVLLMAGEDAPRSLAISASSQPASAPTLQLDHPMPKRDPVKLYLIEAAAGAAAAVVFVPSTLLFGSWLGTLSPNLVAAALPGLLLALAVPPVAVTTAEWLVGRKLQPETTRYQPTIWLAIGVQAVALTLGTLAGVYARNPASLAVFTLCEAVVLPGAVTAGQYLFAPKVAF
jgi:hypothetical protein